MTVGDTDAESSANGLLVNMVDAQRFFGPDITSDIVVPRAALTAQARPAIRAAEPYSARRALIG
jgi:hypothetical protein